MKCYFCEKEFELQKGQNDSCPHCRSYYQYAREMGNNLVYYAYPEMNLRINYEIQTLLVPKIETKKN